jgi:hypothetical protein
VPNNQLADQFGQMNLGGQRPVRIPSDCC